MKKLTRKIFNCFLLFFIFGQILAIFPIFSANIDSENGGWKGINLYGEGSRIEKCVITHIKRPTSDLLSGKPGIQLGAENIIISGNNFNSNYTERGLIYTYKNNATGCSITNNIFHQNTSYGSFNGQGGVIFIYYCDSANVSGNTIFNNYKSGGTNYTIGLQYSEGISPESRIRAAP